VNVAAHAAVLVEGGLDLLGDGFSGRHLFHSMWTTIEWGERMRGLAIFSKDRDKAPDSLLKRQRAGRG
jgi:hypothetical protein